MASPRSQWCLRNPFSHKFMLALLGSFIVLTLVNHYYLSNLSSDCDKVSHKSRNKLDYEDLTIDDRKNLDVKLHIEELHKIKISVSNELRDLESKRQSLQADIAGYTSHIETLRSQYGVLKKEITQVKLTLDQLKFEKEETKAFVPSIKAPQRIIMDTHPSQNMLPPSLPLYCKMETCFDFSRCSLVSGFPVFFYDLQEISLEYPALDEFILSSVVSSFGKSVYATDDPSSACVFIVLMGEIKDGTVNHEQLEHFLYSLPHWNGDGRNHLLINMAHTAHISDMFVNANTGRAVLVQSCFTSSTFRDGFDIVLPPSLGLADGDVWSEIPPLSPIRRKYLLSYWGEYIPTHERARVNDFLHNIKFQNSQDKVEQLRKLQAMQGREEGVVVRPRKLLDIGPELDDSTLGSAIVSWLKELQLSMGDQAFVELSCSGSKVVGMETEWGLCGEAVHRADILSQSTFTLLLLPTNESLVSTGVFQTRLYEALKYGSVPIILGLQRRLPFSEVLRWENAVFTLPLPRVTEIPFFLRTFGDADISLYRSHGRNLWESYFGSTQRILDTVLAVLRTRLQIPAVPAREEPSYSVFNETFVPLKMEGPDPEPETDEVLGPIEPRFPSERFRRNYTHNWILQAFNMPGDPFSLYPFTPFEPVLPSESKFLGSGYGFRPVSQGMGGAGKEFSESLGGNYPREQFTIVMLTYERELMLVQALQRLKGLPFLNKVLVVWNNPSPPSSDLRWPEIGVPLEVVKTRRNSLNNRFLPYSAIETEAVLSIDDDAHLRHDEIVFGFRVWREERDQIVGFPGRYHAWDPKHHTWLYNSNYSCELSMVLTGAAFFHKYYAYLYSYVMPQAIRDKVDQYTNCEDIAMNFLVAHITRKPPIKVTSRWTFRCPGCQNTLSSNDTHFEERHHCINFFMSVYGYMPLLYTQYRVDSVLFKTRLPHDKQKCFKYI